MRSNRALIKAKYASIVNSVFCLLVGFVAGCYWANFYRQDTTSVLTPPTVVVLPQKMVQQNPTFVTKAQTLQNANTQSSLLRPTLKNMDDEQLSQLATQLDILDKNELKMFHNKSHALNRIVDIATSNTSNILPQNMGNVGSLLMSDSPPSDQQVASQNTFSSSTKTIFAVFPTETYSYDSVLVKWYMVDTGNILLLKTMPITRERLINHVYIQNTKGWNLGKYRVEIYSMNDDITLLTYGDYTVE